MENKENCCTLYLVRHGETEWNVEHIIQGQSDSNLTEKGKQQVRETAEEFKNINFDAIYSSDLFRAQSSAEIIKMDRDILIQTSELLRERGFGKFDGMHKDIYLTTLKDEIEKFNNLSEEDSWTYKIADCIETDEEIAIRFINKLREISVGYPGKTVLVVSHGTVISMFLAKIGYLAKKNLNGGVFKNAGYVKIVSNGIDFFVEETNGI